MSRAKTRSPRARKGVSGSFHVLRGRLLSSFGTPGAIRIYLWIGVVGGLWLAGLGVRSYVLAMPRYQIDTGELRVVDRPEWMPERIAADIRVPPELAGRFSVFDPRLVASVARGFTANPWVRQVQEVRKEYPNTIYVSLDLRRPVASVLIEGCWYLVDRDGVRLPGVDFGAPELPDPIPVMKGVRVGPPAPGRPWDDRGVLEGAVVGEIILASQTLRAVDISEIDVSNAGGRVDPRAGEVVLRTKLGTRIVWGRTDLSEGMKLSSQQRLEILENHLAEGLLRTYPKLQGISEIEVRFGQPIIRR